MAPVKKDNFDAADLGRVAWWEVAGMMVGVTELIMHETCIRRLQIIDSRLRPKCGTSHLKCDIFLGMRDLH